MSSIVATRKCLSTSFPPLSSSFLLGKSTTQHVLSTSSFLSHLGQSSFKLYTTSSRRFVQQQQQQHPYRQLHQQRRSFSRTFIDQQQEMKDEYGEMTDEGESYVQEDFLLENNVVLPHAQLRYQTYGKLNDAKDNVVVVCHALTGNASLHSWWGGLLGDHKAFDTSKYFIICCNILGSCYGSTNPQSINPETGSMYGIDFPDISVKDTVRLQLQLLQERIGAKSIKSVIGGSFGGMQAMEFAAQGGILGGDFVTDTGTSTTRRKGEYGVSSRTYVLKFQFITPCLCSSV
jgi:hypothetical protein